MSAAAHWFPAYIGLGSNLQKPAQQIEQALGLVAEMPRTRLVHVSSLYRSAPFGGIEQPDFVNAVASVLTQLGPLELLAQLQDIENRQGRGEDLSYRLPANRELAGQESRPAGQDHFEGCHGNRAPAGCLSDVWGPAFKTAQSENRGRCHRHA